MSIQKCHAGNNLFNYQETGKIWNYIYNQSTHQLESNASFYLSAPISVTVGETYTWRVSADASGSSAAINYPTVAYYNENDNIIGNASYSGLVHWFAFTIPENVKYIRCPVMWRGYEREAMLNIGSSPLPYEAYVEPTWEEIPYKKYETTTDTITTLPADLYADGNNATVGLVGNMSQTGTPTPQNPIQPQETGERTGNLWDGIIGVDNVILNQNGTPTQNNVYALSEYIPVEPNMPYIYHFYHNIAEKNRSTYSICEYDSNKNVILPLVLQQITENRDYNISFTTQTKTAYIRINWKKAPDEDLMLNEGSTALPYEPYGYKIPISSASTTTPVYLGEVETTRKIKKLVLTGQEGWNITTNDGKTRAYMLTDAMGSSDALSSHYIFAPNVFYPDIDYFGINKTSYLIIGIDINVYRDATAFKTYLQQQYSNGTPVTVWYVQSTPTTGIVNEPIRKIGEYADTVSDISIPTTTGADSFDVLTTLKPSEVELTYTGWHDAEVKEWDGSQWQ